MSLKLQTFEKNHWFFITSTILNHINIFDKKVYTEIILSSLDNFVTTQQIYIGAFVVMPNHIHLIVKMRMDNNLSDFNRNFKKFTAQSTISVMRKNEDNLLDVLWVNKNDRKTQIWKRSPNKKNIYSPEFMRQKVEYIHDNPCQTHWLLADKPEDYEYSSAEFYLSDQPNKYVDIFDLRNIM